MPLSFTVVNPELLPAGQRVLEGDVEQFAFSRITRISGLPTGLLNIAPPLTLVGNLLTVSKPVRNWDMTTFAGRGLSLNTSVAGGNFPEPAIRELQVKTTASTTHTFAYPLARQLDQLMIVALVTAAASTVTTPAGWTLVQSQAGTGSRTVIFKRIIDGSEPDSLTITFGTSCGTIIRTWCFNQADDVEAVAAINDSAAGTSLDIGAISPTWSVAEATNNFYLAILGNDINIIVSGFPAGYGVSGQDICNVAGINNVTATLAYAEKTALSSSEDPGAFTYAAARATGHILAIKPKVAGRIEWDGLTVRKNSTGPDVGTQRRLNLIEGAGVTLTIANDNTDGEVDVTIAAAAGSAHTIRVNGTNQTQRGAFNLLDTTTVVWTGTDDAVNNETELRATLPGFTGGDVTSTANSLVLTIANNAVTNTKLADMNANTVKCNPTSGTADPQDLAVSTNNFFGRLAANIQSITGTQATTLLDVFTSALKGLAPASGGGTTNFLRADGTWAAPPGTAVAGHVIRHNGTGLTQRAALNFLNSTTIAAAGTDDAGNNESEITLTLNGFTGGDVTSSANSLLLTIANGVVTNSKLATMLANSVKANPTAGVAAPQDFVISTNNVLGRLAGNVISMTGTQLTTLVDVFTSTLKGAAPASGGGTTNFLRADGTWAAPAGSLGSGVATSVLGVAGGAGARADIQAVTNDTILQRSAGALVWGGVNNAMIPQSEIGIDKLIGGEQEVTTTGALTDLARTLDRTNVLMFSGASAQTVNSVSSSGYNRGVPLIMHSQGASTCDVVDNGSGTATNVFAHYANKNIRLGDDEGGIWVPVDLTPGGTDAKRWLCVSHRWPFHNSSELLIGDKIFHDGVDWTTFNRARKLEWWEDFDVDEGTATQTIEADDTQETYLYTSDTTWSAVVASGSGAATIAAIAGIAQHPGICRMTTSAGGSGGISLTRGNISLTRGVVRRLYFNVRCNTVTTVAFHLTVSNGNFTASNSLDFFFDTAVGTNVRARTASGGTATITDTGVAPGTGFRAYEIQQTTLGTIVFLIDGVVVATHTTNVPSSTTTMNVTISLGNRTTAARTLDVDAVGFESHILER